MPQVDAVHLNYSISSLKAYAKERVKVLARSKHVAIIDTAKFSYVQYCLKRSQVENERERKRVDDIKIARLK